MTAHVCPASPPPAQDLVTTPYPPSLGSVISSRSLLGNGSTLIIEHMGMQYTLRATRNGKLILTK